MASPATATSESLHLESVFATKRRLSEYLNALNILITRSARIILTTRSTLKLLLSMLTVGRMDSRSMIAMTEKGYFTNDIAELLLNL